MPFESSATQTTATNDIFREQASASFGEYVRRRPVLLRTV
jgi:hypothetical protein